MYSSMYCLWIYNLLKMTFWQTVPFTQCCWKMVLGSVSCFIVCVNYLFMLMILFTIKSVFRVFSCCAVSLYPKSCLPLIYFEKDANTHIFIFTSCYLSVTSRLYNLLKTVRLECQLPIIAFGNFRLQNFW